jgi:AcrR family transcriptional regulator
MAAGTSPQVGMSLESQPAREAQSRPTREDAFRCARRTFLAGERVDMRTLANVLHVDRTTVYRWLGSREKLITDILLSLFEPTFAGFREAYCHPGPPGAPGRSPAAKVMKEVIDAVVNNEGMRSFMEREGDLALRLLTTKASGFEKKMIDLARDLLREEVYQGRLAAAIPLDDLPFVVIRIMESYAYINLITGEPYDSDRAERVLNALLPSPANET